MAALQRLDRCLLVHAQYDRILWWVQVQPHDVPHFGGKRRISADFVRSHQVRLEPVSAQELRHGRARQLELPSEQARRPTGSSGRWRRQRRLDDALCGIRRNSMVFATSFRLLFEPRDPPRDEPSANSRHVLLRNADSLGDLASRNTVGAEQHDSGAADMPSVRRASRQQGFQRLALGQIQPKVTHASTDEACTRKIHLSSHAVH